VALRKWSTMVTIKGVREGVREVMSCGLFLLGLGLVVLGLWLGRGSECQYQTLTKRTHWWGIERWWMCVVLFLESSVCLLVSSELNLYIYGVGGGGYSSL